MSRTTIGSAAGSDSNGPDPAAEIKSNPPNTSVPVSTTLSPKGDGKLADALAYPPRLMELERAAAYVGFGRTKFQELVVAGVMPTSLDVKGSPRWDRFDLDRAVDDLKETKTRPGGGIDRIIEKLKRGAT